MSPSGLGQDEPTIIEPSAEGQRRAALAAGLADIFDDVRPASRPGEAPATRGGVDFRRVVEDFRFGEELPPLVGAAAPVMALAVAVRESGAEPDVEALRQLSFATVREYERNLSGARIAPERARAAHYVACAMIDDIVLSRPWGVQSGWARSGLVSTFHMDVTGGDRVFDLLDHFHRNPGANKDILFLIYLCLSLGFEGRTRVSPRGALELAQIRDGLYRTLRGQFGEFERELSPHWRGEAARHKPLRNAAALWGLLGALLLFFALGYVLFLLALNRDSDATLKAYADAVPNATPTVAALATPSIATADEAPDTAPAQTAEQPPDPPRPDPLASFAEFLNPEVSEGLVTLTRDGDSVLVRIRNAGLFAVASAEVEPNLRGLLVRIGTAMAAENFRAVVIGHTDNQPINTVQYPSNWHLSEARAKAVASILTEYAGPGTVTAEGRADTEPVADNATEDGREANRRTEILVVGAASAAGTGVAPAPGRAGETGTGANSGLEVDP
ncbi:type VI secretion system protein TssL, long form [Aureimonas jatrophae]|uniref:Type VI secretion system protein ImpK n=1 Tax=Aureimonas jatrophae TaxID=1166073 RepID=A0A1H0N3A7_9HYPH|nr:type VI secretion system protein TssL, long form [Aureimonas jatrophae]MBB3953018.1 type VI secretion system protein ImpK [Aureimonas jatrophae]SDO87214.1 type VI secretion system protein ImpK [Aureimonas jatrophae]